MFRTLAFTLICLGILVMIGTEVLRSVIHRRREKLTGIGGTQDIAMWGTIISLVLFISAGICGLLWNFQE